MKQKGAAAAGSICQWMANTFQKINQPRMDGIITAKSAITENQGSDTTKARQPPNQDWLKQCPASDVYLDLNAEISFGSCGLSPIALQIVNTMIYSSRPMGKMEVVKNEI